MRDNLSHLDFAAHCGSVVPLGILYGCGGKVSWPEFAYASYVSQLAMVMPWERKLHAFEKLFVTLQYEARWLTRVEVVHTVLMYRASYV